jgi:hypothetical protein
MSSRRRVIWIIASAILGLSVAGFAVGKLALQPRMAPAAASILAEQRSVYAQDCNNGDETNCIFLEIIDKASNEGVDTAMSELDLQRKSNKALDTRCHALAHTFGEIAYTEQGLPALTKVSGNCAWGAIHGVLKGWAEATEIEMIKIKLEKVCEAFAEEGNQAVFICIHGTGHALSTVTGSWSKAGAICIESYETTRASSCLGGAVMEFVDKENSKQKRMNTTEIKDELTRCREMTPLTRECVKEFGLLIVSQLEMDFLQAGKFCSELSKEFIEGCGFGLGSVAYSTSNGDPKLAVSNCSKIIGDNIRSECAAGAALGTTNMLTAKYGEDICALIDKKARAKCEDSLPFLREVVESNNKLTRGF